MSVFSNILVWVCWGYKVKMRIVMERKDKDHGKSNNSSVDLMEAGTTEQCLNAQERPTEEENERARGEEACSTFPTRHSLPVCKPYSAPRRKRRMRLTHRHTHTHVPHYVGIEARGIILRTMKWKTT